MKQRHTSIRMNDKLFELITKRARKERTTRSNIITDALYSYLVPDNNTELNLEEKNFLLTSLTYKYLMLGEKEYTEHQEQIIKDTKDLIKSSK